MASTSVQTAAAAAQVEPRPAAGKYGEYFEPVMEADAMRKIVAEGCSMNPGTAAVLLQIASKGVGKGVSAHSSFTKRPVERARRSLVYIYGMAFGSPAERRAITDATHRAHSRVKGAGYDADDVDLQLWVAATIYWSLVAGYEEVYGPLDEATADRVYAEFSVMATGLTSAPGKWPRDRAEFRRYWDRTIAELEITPEAREVALDVLYPGKNLPWGPWVYAKLHGPTNRIVTAEMLPERIRNEFGIPSTLYTRTMYAIKTASDRAVYPFLPDAVRHFAKDHFMQDFRSRLARGARL